MATQVIAIYLTVVGGVFANLRWFVIRHQCELPAVLSPPTLVEDPFAFPASTGEILALLGIPFWCAGKVVGKN